VGGVGGCGGCGLIISKMERTNKIEKDHILNLIKKVKNKKQRAKHHYFLVD
jgi:carbonic anhydrase